ncbi:MAG TPA: Lrp/AsnC family transcriptional regulator [Vicinamibacterales bacterium]|jgi:DNA-binding Lrp family transcriptional regulator
MQLDDIDLKILEHLQQNARISNVDLAEQVGLSPAPCLRRVRALEEAGVIRRYLALVDQTALNIGVTVFVQVTLDLQVEGRLEIFEHAIMSRPEVLECYLMTGDADYLLRVVVPDVPAYERFLRDTLTRIESAAGIKSSFALKQVKYFTGLPLTYSRRTAGAERPEGGRAKPPQRPVRQTRGARKRGARRSG